MGQPFLEAAGLPTDSRVADTLVDASSALGVQIGRSDGRTERGLETAPSGDQEYSVTRPFPSHASPLQASRSINCSHTLLLANCNFACVAFVNHSLFS